MPSIRRVGHRGASAHEPQNTVRSFERAIAMGVDMVEIDLRQSRDGALVLAHDPTIRGGGRELAVAVHDLESLRALDLGHSERIATLAMESPPNPTAARSGFTSLLLAGWNRNRANCPSGTTTRLAIIATASNWPRIARPCGSST